ncbi:hypothetical protein SBRCBS47491_009611 [Sporothrix bragantina]|uniref:NADH:flavin oxidoreductase/NADH oxidase N-terminal domain-containing protein n=1 Tax=Sporothrix bragantina TaxID=671064 RepID=A0ABP0CZM0_9PEZI
MSDSALFSAVRVGRIDLAHRVVMAPMTRRRATLDYVPTPLMIEYYAQRAVVPGTLLITEATSVSPWSAALPNTPGLFTQEQIDAWKPVTKAVHDRGSFVYVQLWMCGRAARPGAVKRGAEVVSASDVPVGPESPVPRPLTEEEIQTCIADYRQASINAIAAGFDGVELHGANGYLLDQFTQDVTNKRTDNWGGSVAKRSRFGVAVATAVAEAIGADRVGYRVSPWSRHHGMRMEDPVPQFTDLVIRLKALKLAYLHVIEGRVQANADLPAHIPAEPVDFVADIWGTTSPVIFAGGYNAQTARQRVESEAEKTEVTESGETKRREALVAFGRTFVSNPDLPRRVQEWLPVVRYNRDLFYEVGSPDGYTDYPEWVEDVSGEKTVVLTGNAHQWPAATVGTLVIN